MSTALQHKRGVAGVVPLSVVDANGLSVGGAPTGGTFTLGYSGATTAGLNYNAVASDVQAALVALSTIGTSNATVTGGPPPTAYVITFPNLGNAAALVATEYFVGGMNPALSVATTREFQDIGAQAVWRAWAEGETLGGTYTITVGEVTTDPIAASGSHLDCLTSSEALNTLLGVTVGASGGGTEVDPAVFTYPTEGAQGAFSVDFTNLTGATVSGYDTQNAGASDITEQQTVGTTSDVPVVWVTKDGAYQAVSTNTAVSTGYAFAITLTAAEKTADAIGLTLVCPTGFFGRAETIYTTNEPANLSALSISETTGVVKANDASGNAVATAANQTTIIGYVDCLPATWVVPAAVGAAMTLTAAYDAAKTAAQPGADGDTLKTLSDQLDAAASPISISSEGTNIITDN